MTRGPSPHLSWSELACKDGTPYPEEWRRERAVILAGVFEAIRAACGDRPIGVTSAYRTSRYNRRVGGVANSQHVYGRALDLRPPKGMTIAQFYRTIRPLADSLPIRGLGRYPTFVHVDIRPTDRLAIWGGSQEGQ